MVYKRVSSALFFSIVWMLLVCLKVYSQKQFYARSSYLFR